MENPLRPPERHRRGAQIDPPNRFATSRTELDYDQRAFDDSDLFADSINLKTQFLPDASKSVLTHNDSPDVGFEWSVNPYRGCEHGCAYCYARPTHETLGMNAGSDFESRIMVKHDAPVLLRAAISKPSWRPAPINFSGVTDCYQPAERRFRLTRQCLQILYEHRNPATIVTKNVLLLRDLPLLKEMAARGLIQVILSVTTLDAELAATMEPRTPPPAARLEAVRRLSAAGIPTGVLMAPLVPGLTDHEIPTLLAAVAAAGARMAGYTILRLPLAVKPIFLDWLERSQPLRATKVLGLLRQLRGGELNDAEFGSRMRGEGPYAQTLNQTFKLFAKRLGLDRGFDPLNTSDFRRNGNGPRQLELFR